MFNLNAFGLGEMARLGAGLRKAGDGVASMEEAASKATRFVFESLVDGSTGPGCALVRLFKTHLYAELPSNLQEFARGIAGEAPHRPGLRCLTLLGTAGQMPAWNARGGSGGHKAIPLISEESVKSIPMVAALVNQLGLEIKDVVSPGEEVFLEKSSSSLFNVFHVLDARGSPLVPSQEDFVLPFGVRSVIGFGGRLRSREIFAVILFSKVAIDSATAQLFRTLSLNVKLALSPHEHRVFT
jgi:hypothetical protein